MNIENINKQKLYELKNLKNNLKNTILTNLYVNLKIPLLAYCKPIILEKSKERNVLKIKLGFITRNHLKSMYFGALCMGGEATVAFGAAQLVEDLKKERNIRVDFVFKDFKAEFLRRPESHVYFVCDQGAKAIELIEKSIQSGQRENALFQSYAVCFHNDEPEIVATFEVTMSVKMRQPKA